LTGAGYDVRVYGKNDALAPASFAGSVAEAGSPRGVPGPANPWPRDDPRYFSFLFGPGGAPTDHADYRALAAGLDFLRQPHEQPFCLFLPLGLPHPPYTAPEPFHAMYAPDALPPLRPPTGEGHPRYHQQIRQSRRLDEVDDV